MTDTATTDTGTTDDAIVAPEIPRLKTRYNDEIRAKLKEQLSITNVMEVPNFGKIVSDMPGAVDSGT